MTPSKGEEDASRVHPRSLMDGCSVFYHSFLLPKKQDLASGYLAQLAHPLYHNKKNIVLDLISKPHVLQRNPYVIL